MGVLAALVDIFLIKMPRHPGFLGGEQSEGGPLANWIRDRIDRLVPKEDIEKLARETWVPFDASTSQNLNYRVAGISPSMHRFQSLGHDPVLGFIFGVADILRGTFTAIDKNGKLIIQPAQIKDPTLRTMNLFEAIGRVLWHLVSDVATPQGLPVPLMPLLQFLQVGHFGKHGYTIAEISRAMYRSHYDCRHFLAMSGSPLLIEIIVRLCYFSKRMYEGHSLEEAIPFELSSADHKPKLRTMLFCAHLVSTAANSGKFAITRNPLALNYSQWLAFFYYSLMQIKWVLFEKETERGRFVQEALDRDWEQIDKDWQETWTQVMVAPIILS